MREALVEAIGRALRAVTPDDAASFFAHAGYRPQDQPLRVPLSEVRRSRPEGLDDRDERRVPAPSALVSDTTEAGDAFNGASCTPSPRGRNGRKPCCS